MTRKRSSFDPSLPGLLVECSRRSWSSNSPKKVLNKNGKPIDKGYLYRVLHNRVYLGEAVHKGTAYRGEHAPIVDRNIWDQVHQLISASPPARTKRTLGRAPSLLKGLIFGPTGTAMTPAHTRRRGRLYRYYVSTDTIRTGNRANPIRRIPAAEIEAVVIAQIKIMLCSPEIIVATWRTARKSMQGSASDRSPLNSGALMILVGTVPR